MGRCVINVALSNSVGKHDNNKAVDNFIFYNRKFCN